MPNSPRFVTGANQDLTGRTLSIDQQAPAYAATISPSITAVQTIIGPIAITGALTFNPTIASSYIGDRIIALFSNGTGGALVVTFGANTSNAGTLSVAAGKKGSIHLFFDGLTWVECGRAATA